MGGAKNCPETPRQRMIGMMYLVLTAMLALNVSADIINGYAKVDSSLHTTIKSVQESNNYSYMKLNAAMQQNPDKTREWYGRAQQVKAQSDSLYNYIQAFKDQLVLLADGAEAKKDASVGDMNKKDDTNVPHQFGINEGHGATLKQNIIAYREFMDAITDKTKTAELSSTFNVDDVENNEGEMVSWETTLFHEMPVCATLTMLTKFQNDIRTEENNALTWFERQTDAGDVRVNKINAYVIPKSSYVISGGKYSAQIIMAAIDSTQTPEYFVNGNQIGDNGLYEIVAKGIGSHKYKGQIAYLDPSGEKQFLDFESEYTVGEPTVTISNTEMNIMYRGFDNKFNISVPGVSNDKLKVDVQGASLTKKGDLWIIKPAESSKQVVVSVKAEMEKGKFQAMGSQTYRVKQLPKPGAFFVAGGQSLNEGALSRKDILDSKSYVEASYGPDGILDIDFSIVSFQISAAGKFYDSKSDKFTGEQINAIKQLRSGEQLSIQTIRAKGPDGKVYPLSPIVLKIK